MVVTLFFKPYFFPQKIYSREKVMYIQKVSEVISYVKCMASYCETIHISGLNLYSLANNSSLTIFCIDSFLFMYLIN